MMSKSIIYKEMKYILCLILCFATLFVWGQSSDKVSECNKAQIAILGVFHFSNPELDIVKQQHKKDILSAQGQKEVDVILEQIEKFQPTKILVECDIKDDSVLNVQYKKYINNRFQLKENEIYQIGFKLAKRLGHVKLWAIDSPMWFAEEKDSLLFDENYCNMYPLSHRHNYDSFYEEGDSLQMALPLWDYLKYLNRVDTQRKEHQVYLTKYATVGTGDSYVGVNVVSNWYKRNLKIYANICNITNYTNNERLLLIIGAGHTHLLNQFFTDSPDYKVINITN